MDGPWAPGGAKIVAEVPVRSEDGGRTEGRRPAPAYRNTPVALPPERTNHWGSRGRVAPGTQRFGDQRHCGIGIIVRPEDPSGSKQKPQGQLGR